MIKLRRSLYPFFQGALLSYRALFRWLTPSTYVATKVIVPLGQILFFSFLGMFATDGSNTSFYVIGNSVQLAALSGIFGVTMSISGDRWEGTLPYLLGTPANRLSIFVGRALIHIFDGAFGVAIGLFWGVTLLGLDLTKTHPISLIIVLLITTFSTSGMGLMLGSLSLVTRHVMFINNTVYYALLIFSGSNIALEMLPAGMRRISNMLPLTRGITASRKVIEGARLAEVGPLMLEETLVGLAYITAGFLLFKWFEIQARRRGTLEAI